MGLASVTIERRAGQQRRSHQASFVEHAPVQCGFCAPGMVLTCHASLFLKLTNESGSSRSRCKGMRPLQSNTLQSRYRHQRSRSPFQNAGAADAFRRLHSPARVDALKDCFSQSAAKRASRLLLCPAVRLGPRDRVIVTGAERLMRRLERGEKSPVWRLSEQG